jgi:hypothetical protein
MLKKIAMKKKELDQLIKEAEAIKSMRVNEPQRKEEATEEELREDRSEPRRRMRGDPEP